MNIAEKAPFSKSQVFFINVLEPWLKRYFFISGENNNSSKLEFLAHWAFAVDAAIDTVAQRSFLEAMERKVQFLSEKYTF